MNICGQIINILGAERLHNRIGQVGNNCFGLSTWDFEEIAMRQLNLEKAFNLRFTDLARADDLPTPRDLSEPIPTGKLKGWKIDKAAYDRLLNEYYALHGWDKETSYPTRETLVKYGLGYVADDLEKIGKLGK
ncbi:MAG: hypothetical protein GX770_05855 [Firmicutes bacterium]|nr:hypothetical protein [Bacillota bacterium]